MFSTILTKKDALHDTVHEIRDEQKTVAADLRTQIEASSTERNNQLAVVHGRIDKVEAGVKDIKDEQLFWKGKVIGGIAVGSALSGVIGWLGSKWIGK